MHAMRCRKKSKRCAVVPQVGQILWAAVAVDERPARTKRIEDPRLVPVILDLVTAQDIHETAAKGRRAETRLKKSIRLCRQASEQKAVLNLAGGVSGPLNRDGAPRIRRC